MATPPMRVQFAVATVQNIMSDIAWHTGYHSPTRLVLTTGRLARVPLWPSGNVLLPQHSLKYDPNNSYSDIVFQNMRLYDNFSVLADNNHPGSYSYYVKLVTEEPFALSDQTSNVPAIATVQNGKTYAYFEAQYEDWYGWELMHGMVMLNLMVHGLVLIAMTYIVQSY